MAALVLGTVLALAALAYVLWPLFRGADEPMSPASPMVAPETSAIDALREIEFDQATGKLSAEDYSSLRASYTPLALAELRERDRVDEAAAAEDAAEALIARVRSRAAAGASAAGASAGDGAGEGAGAAKVCGSCGPRPESDAVFCSDCGASLAA